MLYDHVRDLSLEIDTYRLEGRSAEVSSGFLRKTTIVVLEGGGCEGVGEDVTYDAAEHDRTAERGPDLPLAGTWTLDSFSRHLATLPLFDHEPDQHAYLDYRRWGYESAALDLALRQADRSLGAVVERPVEPLSFVVSTRLGDPASTERLRAWLELYPGQRFKLDATSSWSDDLVEELARLGCVDSVDFKGQYHGTAVDSAPDASLYRRVVEGLPEAWLEDPALTAETLPILEPVAERITWDAPIHAVADIEALHWPPRTVNVKPSRFGTVERLFAGYDYCADSGIAAYGGGQFELGPGRGQIQLLAALFHPGHPERCGADRLQRTRGDVRPTGEPALGASTHDRVRHRVASRRHAFAEAAEAS